MRVALVSNLRGGEQQADLIGYNQVMAYHLHRELVQHCECHLVKDQEVVDTLPEVDFAIGINSVGIRTMAAQMDGDATPKGQTPFRERREAIEARSRVQFWLTDGPERGLLRIGRPATEKQYVGMGVDPGVCFPEQQTGGPIVLLNAWNQTVQNDDLSSDKVQQNLERACRILADRGAQIWALNCRFEGMTKVLGRIPDPKDNMLEGNGRRVGYIPWEQMCAHYRRGWVLLDGTPKVVELGRLEAQACGAACCMAGHGLAGKEPYWDTLPHLLWEDGTAQEIADIVQRELDTFDLVTARLRHVAVLKHFNWPTVAKRLLDALEVWL